jgi:ubiquinone/menaquinone biosynthesis C-methylase UbiE
MKRVVEEEWLDADRGSPEEVQSALRSIGAVNLLFGGNRTHTHLLRTVARRAGADRLQVLEVASGRGQVIAAAARSLAREGLMFDITLLDLNRSHLPDAWPRGLAPPRTLEGNALAMPLADKSVDIVSCCLFLHHLSPEEAVTFLREGLRVCRVAVVINDLERTRGHAALSSLFSLVDPSRISRHDGPASVRQAYTREELQAMFDSTGRRSQIKRRFLYRMAGVLWGQDCVG